MISHQEAEVLTSARQDAPLDPLVERELQAHLATCDQCRAFAAATERLTAGLRTLPTVAANPRVKREVMNRVRAGRNPFASVLGGFGSGFQPGPALAAVALVALIGLFGWIAMDRLFFEDGNDGNNQIAAVPTESVTREAPNPTATLPAVPTATTAVAPTATTAAAPTATTAAAPRATTAIVPTATTPAQPTATTAPAPTATTAPQPTATTAPVPTATTAPAPTATLAPQPTATTAPQPTGTDTASAARTTEEGPVDLTTASEVTAEPTETPVPPTETAVPPTETPAPTATNVPPTETPAPTATEVPPTETPAPTETPQPTPSPTPGIEPMEGSTSVPVEQGNPTAESGIGSADGNAVVPTAAIEPNQTGEAASTEAPTATETAGDGTGGTEEPVGIELIDSDGETTTVVTTPDATNEATTEATTEPTATLESETSTEPLADVSERYQGIVGDPSEHLGLTRDGRLEFMAVPDGASMTTSDGYRLQSADVQPGVVNLCTDSGCEPGMDAPEVAENWQGDVPMGTVDGTVYILRLYADRSEVYAASAEGSQLIGASLVGELGPTAPPAAVYESGGVLYAWLPSGQWLEMSGNSAQALSGSYANPTNVRFAPSANGGPLIGYFSGGTLIVAPAGSPDAAVLTLPVSGVDFDIAPAGDRVAVIQGNSIVIYDIQGNQLTTYDGGGMQPGSLIWLRGGIVWVDRNDGALYQIPETAP